MDKFLKEMKEMYKYSQDEIRDTNDYGVEQYHEGICSVLRVFIEAIENGEYISNGT